MVAETGVDVPAKESGAVGPSRKANFTADGADRPRRNACQHLSTRYIQDYLMEEASEDGVLIESCSEMRRDAIYI